VVPCRKKTPYGKCESMKMDSYSWCGYHTRRELDPESRSDSYYEQKVVAGLVTPTDHWMTDIEDDALFRGRTHNDGRRLDHWARP
jgi:hypothetical protein